MSPYVRWITVDEIADFCTAYNRPKVTAHKLPVKVTHGVTDVLDLIDDLGDVRFGESLWFVPKGYVRKNGTHQIGQIHSCPGQIQREYASSV